jgi:hypothetical protein
MRGELFSQEYRIAFGKFVRVTRKTGTGDDLPRGVLETRQSVPHHLRPIIGNILKILRIGGDLAEDLPFSLDRAQLLLRGWLFLSRSSQAMRTNDPRHGIVADLQIKLLHQSLSAEAGLFSQFDDLTFQARGRFVRTEFRRSRQFNQRRRFPRNVAAQPFSDRVPRSAKLAHGCFNAVLAGKRDDLLMEPMAVSSHAIQFKV